MSNDSIKFKANKNKATFIGLGFGYLIIIVSIVPAVVFLPEKNLQGLLNLAIPIVLCLFFTYVLVSSTLKVLITYIVSEKGISIKKPLSRTIQFNWEDIEGIEYVGVEKTQEILSDCVKSQFQLREDQDIGGYIRLLKNKSPMYKYFTLVTEAKLKTSGETGHLHSLRIEKSEGMILLALKENKSFYLTPSDPMKFANECTKYISI